MDLLLRAVEHLSVGTLELLHQLRKKRVFLSPPVFYPNININGYTLSIEDGNGEQRGGTQRI